MAPDDPGGARPEPVVLRIKLRYPDIDTMIQRFAPNVGKSGLFLPTRAAHPPGTEIKFELRLATDQPILVGMGRVKELRLPDPNNPRVAFGLAVELMRVTRDGRDLILKMLERRRQLGLSDVAIPVPNDIEVARRVDVDTNPRIALPVPPPISTEPAVLTAPRPYRRVTGPVAVPTPEPAAKLAPLAPEPPRKRRVPVGELIESASGPIATPAAAADEEDAVDVGKALVRARTLAGNDLEKELEVLLDSAAAPVAIDVEAASAELARQLGGVPVRRGDRTARARWAPPPAVSEQSTAAALGAAVAELAEAPDRADAAAALDAVAARLAVPIESADAVVDTRTDEPAVERRTEPAVEARSDEARTEARTEPAPEDHEIVAPDAAATAVEPPADEPAADEVAGDVRAHEAARDEVRGDTRSDEDKVRADEAAAGHARREELRHDVVRADEAVAGHARRDELRHDLVRADDAVAGHARGDRSWGDKRRGDEIRGDETRSDEGRGEVGEVRDNEVRDNETVARGDEWRVDEAVARDTRGDEAELLQSPAPEHLPPDALDALPDDDLRTRMATRDVLPPDDDDDGDVPPHQETMDTPVRTDTRHEAVGRQLIHDNLDPSDFDASGEAAHEVDPVHIEEIHQLDDHEFEEVDATFIGEDTPGGLDGIDGGEDVGLHTRAAVPVDEYARPPSDFSATSDGERGDFIERPSSDYLPTADGEPPLAVPAFDAPSEELDLDHGEHLDDIEELSEEELIDDFEILAESDIGEDEPPDAAELVEPPTVQPGARRSVSDFALRLDLPEDSEDSEIRRAPKRADSMLDPVERSAGAALAGFSDEDSSLVDRSSGQRRGPRPLYDESSSFTVPGAVVAQPRGLSQFDESDVIALPPSARPTTPPPSESDLDLESALEALDVDLDDLSIPHASTELRREIRNVAERQQPEKPKRATTDGGLLIDFDDDD